MGVGLVFPAAQLRALHQGLREAYGPQAWWPAESDFEVMVGAVLTQNTAWTNVERAIANLKTAGMLEAGLLAEAEPSALAEFIRPAGYFNVKTKRLQALCRYLVEAGFEGDVEAAFGHLDTEILREQLLAVHGVGPETADDILLYALRRPVFVIDTYTRRLFARLGLCVGDEPYDALRLGVEQALQLDHLGYNELHALIVVHAKAHCRKRPLCTDCPLAGLCRQHGI
jgi:endonuclease-3 related protein